MQFRGTAKYTKYTKRKPGQTAGSRSKEDGLVPSPFGVAIEQSVKHRRSAYVFVWFVYFAVQLNCYC